MPESIIKPKVFISYSWSSQEYKNFIKDIADILIDNGISVIIDIYDLTEGHDKISFMEKISTDTSISHVLIMCDKVYMEKANSRKAGIGIESQIISQEIYDKMQQNKFIPIVCEMENGKPLLPVFINSRIYIDFSTEEKRNQNMEQLIRTIYGKPIYEKPPLGTPPVYITNPQAHSTNKINYSLNILKDALSKDKKGIALYRRNFLSACIEHIETLRIRTAPPGDYFSKQILDDCSKHKEIRNYIIDWISFESEFESFNQTESVLIGFLEKLIELKENPPELNSYNTRWFIANHFFVYELVIYIIAALIKSERYKFIGSILQTKYLRAPIYRSNNNRFEDFETFYFYSDVLNEALGNRYYAPAAELLHRQADRVDIPFDRLIESDFICYMMALLNDVHWYPQTHYYMGHKGIELFMLAERKKDYLKICDITGYSNSTEIKQILLSKTQQIRGDFQFKNIAEIINFNRWDTI